MIKQNEIDLNIYIVFGPFPEIPWVLYIRAERPVYH
jgi:hypothetical protein